MHVLIFLVVQRLRLHTSIVGGAWVQALVRELNPTYHADQKNIYIKIGITAFLLHFVF